MTRFLMLPLAVPLACLALLSLIAFLGVVALAAALRLFGHQIRLRIAGRNAAESDPWHGHGGRR